MKEKSCSGAKAADRAAPVIAVEECKACGRCVRACPEGLLSMSKQFNRRGYRYAEYAGQGCTGCGLCFFSCPEPHALKVIRPERKQ